MTTLPTTQPLHSRKCGPLKGTIKVPGDKSLSHRALIFGALSVGETRIEGLLEGEDVLATAEALRALGAEITRDEAGVWHVWGRGIGGLKAPIGVLDLGNSGTGARLLMGVVAGQPIRATFTGDGSLSSRPMGRIFDPLKQMGAAVTAAAGDQLPATVTGPARLRPMSYELPKPSAQIKSAVLLAGLAAPGITEVIEPEPTRDHTERMARAFGASVDVEDKDGKRHIRLTGQPELVPVPVSIASDPSSAAFPAVAALITKGSELVIEGVMTNPTRTGLYKTLTEMGADIAFRDEREVAGETVGDLVVRSSALKGGEVPASRAPSMIDEYPVLAVAAAFASGPTVMHGLAELRVKESDRLSAIATGLKAIGVNVTETEDSLTVEGCNGEVPGDGTIATHMDHRIAMAFLVAGTGTKAAVKVDDGAFIETSFPGFADLMNGLGAKIERSNR